MVAGTIEKLFKMDDHLGAVAAGLLADARVLVSQLRVKAQVHKITFEEPIDVWSLARHLGDRMQISTLYAGLRPFGASFLIGGIDSTGPHLIESDPSGMLYEWKAYALGRGSVVANKLFKDRYKDGMDEKTAVKLVVDVIKKSEKFKDSEQALEVAVISGDRKFSVLTPQELRKL